MHLLTLLYVLPLALPQSKPQATQAKDVKRPKYSLLPQNEDWSVLADVQLNTTGDFTDRVKYLQLDDDGDAWWSVGGHAWTRVESWKGFNFGGPPGADPDDVYAVSRLLLHADVHFSPEWRAFVEGKTAQATDRSLVGGRRTVDADWLDLQQAFVDYVAPLGDGTTVRVGRQMLSFGNQRLVSPLPWGNALRTWEGVTAAVRQGAWTVTGLFTRFVPVDKGGFNKGDDDNLLFGVYATRAPEEGGVGRDLYWLGISREDQSFNGTTGDEVRQTLGGRAWGPWGERGGTWEVEAAGQVGEVGDGDVLAWMVAANAGAAIGNQESPWRWNAGLDWASGDRQAGGDVETFNQIFPLGHAYYGFIDTIARQNAIDGSLGLRWRASSAVTTRLDLHGFWLADASDALYNAGGGVVRPGGASDGTFIGSEIDLTANWRIDRHVSALFGWSHFFPDEVISDSGPDEEIDFVYVSLAYWF